ncbi:alpha/beta fold hydrolase [Amycolatopsis anabasis]|uniref:alpha/beta fold hydrolase n=1 Tax=Amycolatopsis anabasis TaxID=1840409 RepID=UPI00131DDF2E|nr:alpha/beta hydrolase [Amycolatopsis anabasis]
MTGPRPPDEYVVRFTDTPHGRVRSRILGPRREAPPVVAVMGMAVSDYLLPALSTLSWSQVHLLDLPGLAGSGPPPQPLDVPGYAECVASWLDAADLPPVVLLGHSSGTQVAARTAVARPDRTAALVLASPTVDPKARSVPRALFWWRMDSHFPLPGLRETHIPEWRRAGFRQLVHLLLVHLRDRLEEVMPEVPCPVLVIRGEQDALSSDRWAAELATLAADGRFVTTPGPHTFVWYDPHAWCGPIRELATGRRVS